MLHFCQKCDVLHDFLRFIIYVFLLSDVSKHATVTVTEHFIPSVAGTRKLVASLDCKQLSQVHGVADIIVHERQ